MIVIGSRAVDHWYPAEVFPQDWDFICTMGELEFFKLKHSDKFKGLHRTGDNKFTAKILHQDKVESVEFFIADGKNTNSLFNPYIVTAHSPHSTLNFAGMDATVAPIDVLVTLKRSHIGFPIHWEKNIADYHFLKTKGAKVIETLYKQREKEVEERFSRPESQRKYEDGLKKSNIEFFGNYKVKRLFDHDWLHEIVAFYDRPLFERIKPDLSKAAVSETLFKQLSYNDAVKLIQEECFVLALERVLIPLWQSGDEKTAQFLAEPWDMMLKAFKTALMRISTNLKDNPTWIKEFALEQYPDVSLWFRGKDSTLYWYRFLAAVGTKLAETK